MDVIKMSHQITPTATNSDLGARLGAIERELTRMQTGLEVAAATAVHALIVVLLRRGVIERGEVVELLEVTLSKIDSSEPNLLEHPGTAALARLLKMQAATPDGAPIPDQQPAAEAF
ncbi:hypothetical protein WDZ92_30030 [Nostoc sp. NIES-2111]